MPPLPLPKRVLCLVTALDPGEDSAILLSSISAAVRGGVNMIQVRAPELERTDFFNLAAAVIETIGDDALVVIDNRVDVALAVDAGGVQLGERGPAVKAARRVGGDDWLIGRSVHSLDGATKAEMDLADYLLLGTIYETTSHPGQLGVGIDLLNEVAASVQLPIIGIGGINPERAAAVVSAGARGVAVIGAILGSDDPERAAANLRTAIEKAVSDQVPPISDGNQRTKS
jgi:thiamine-phosphate pyrophosphorylase